MDEQNNNQYQAPPQAPQGQYQAPQGQYQPPQANPYQAPQGAYYGQPPVPTQKNGNAIAGMVLGIVSLAFCWAWYIGFPAGIVGLILSIMAKKQGPNKMATAGLVCSIIGLAISAVIGIIAIIACASLSSYGYWY